MTFKCKGRLVSKTAGRLAQKQPSFKECVTAHLNNPDLIGMEILRLKWSELKSLPKTEDLCFAQASWKVCKVFKVYKEKLFMNFLLYELYELARAERESVEELSKSSEAW